MPTSITAYTTFSFSGRASPVLMNQNFSNHRGDLLPIDETIPAASDNIHNLGSSDHAWVEAYLSRLNFSGVTTVGLYITGDTAGTGLEFYIDNTLSAKFDSDGMHFFSQEFRDVTVTAAIEGQIAEGSIPGNSIYLATTNALINEFAQTFTCSKPAPVMIYMSKRDGDTSDARVENRYMDVRMCLLRDGVTLGCHVLGDATGIGRSPAAQAIKWIDFPNTTGAVTYEFGISIPVVVSTTTAITIVRSMAPVIYEL